MSVNIRGKCNSCCVPGCHSNTTPSFRNRGGRITTFKLPRDEARRKEWIQAIPKRKYPPTVNHNVCILHFNEEDFSRNNRRIDLKKSAVPSIFPFVDGQTMDESSDLCDEAWTEYVAHKKEAVNRTLDGNVENGISTSASDIARILIERLRIPGSMNFGIGTSEISLQPDSDIESDACEPKTTADTKPPRKRIRKSIKCDDEEGGTSDEFNFNFDDIDATYSPLAGEESLKPVEVSRSESVATVSDNEDKFGAMVSSKLLLMSPLQRLMSEKIISEILLKGQLGMLKSSFSPVLVNGFMKNGADTTGSNFASTDCLSPMGEDSDDKDSVDDCDPLMPKVEQDREQNTKPFEFVKNECCWPEDDEF
ncbi:hypothetical protein HA402_007421 [Bradysia odoriphaga]|nr:hypothetical protein HA402_007421 [Bradysia odoriphaga]